MGAGVGAETAGAETAVAETAGAETGGAETAGAETAGAETVGAETAEAVAETADTTGKTVAPARLATFSASVPQKWRKTSKPV